MKASEYRLQAHSGMLLFKPLHWPWTPPSNLLLRLLGICVRIYVAASLLVAIAIVAVPAAAAWGLIRLFQLFERSALPSALVAPARSAASFKPGAAGGGCR